MRDYSDQWEVDPCLPRSLPNWLGFFSLSFPSISPFSGPLSHFHHIFQHISAYRASSFHCIPLSSHFSTHFRITAAVSYIIPSVCNTRQNLLGSTQCLALSQTQMEL